MLEKNNYFSINEILATQTRMPTKVLHEISGMGKLKASNESDDLTVGTKLELPLWMVNDLSRGQAPLLQPLMPKVYNEAYREILKADPSSVDLSKLSLYFYHVGNHLKDINVADKDEVAKTLQNTFKERFRQLMDISQNIDCSMNVVNKLDMLEKQLFEDGFRARRKLNSWLNENATKLEAASIVVNHKKRKRVNDMY